MAVFSQGGVVYEWAKNIGSSGNENIRSIKTSSSGFVFITGGFQGTCDFDPGAGVSNLSSSGSNDIFFAKYTATGNLVWVKKVGSTGDDFSLALQLGTNDTIVIAGYFSGAPNLVDFDPNPSSTLGLASAGQSDGFIAKYDSAGNYQWVRRVAGTGFDYVYDMVLDASENILITGSYASPSLNFEDPDAVLNYISVQSSSDAFFAKYDRNGFCLYGKGFAGTGTSDIGRGIAVDAAGDVYICGQFIGTCDFNADTDPGQVANLTSYNATNTDAFLTKYTSAGVYQWAQRLGGNSAAATSPDWAFCVTPALAGGVIVGGQYYGVGLFGTLQITAQGTGQNGFFAHYDATGACTWAKGIGGSGGEAQVYSVDVDNSGNVFVAGRFKAIIDFDGSVAAYTLTSNPTTANDIFLCKYNSSGDLLWANPMGSTGSDEAMRVHVDGTNNIFLCGYFTGTADFDPLAAVQSLTAIGGNDGFFAKYTQCTLLSAPTAISGIDTSCSSFSGQTFVATPVAGATSYTWSVPAGWQGTSTTNSITLNSNMVTGTLNVKANNACGSSPAKSKTITMVFPAQAPSSVTGTQIVCPGTLITYTANGGSGGNYRWTVPSGWSIVGRTDTSYITALIGSTSGAVAAARTSFCGTSSYTSYQVTVYAAPNGNVSPLTPTICAGSSVTLTASGGTSYAWSNGLGAGASKTVSPVSSTTYMVTISQTVNACTDVDTVEVTVNPAPTAGISPATVSICNGDQATLTASGGTAYTWSNNGGSNAAATFSPTTTTTYTVTVTDNNCSATASRLVTVNTIPSASISPVTASICSGASATLTASGGTTYAWSNSGGSNAAATFSPTTTTTYTVTVSNGTCSATATRIVTVNSLPPAAIAPASVAVCVGASATLTASGGTTYAWSNSGGSNAAATFSPTTTTTYTVTVTDGNNCSTTATRQVTVNQLPVAVINPSSVTICSGASQNLIASGGVSYNWSNQLGTGPSKLVLPVATTTYTVTVTDANNCTATASSVVTVNPITNITTEPVSQTACTGSAVTFSVAANGTGLTYQWKKNGANINLATLSSYNIPSLTINDADNYSVVVTGTCGADTSALAVLSVVTSASISQQPLAQAVCVGAPLTLSVVGSGGNNTTYVWRRGSTVLGSQTTSTLSIVSATANDAGPYSVVISGSCGTVASDTVLVTVNNNPTAAISGNGTICNGTSTTLTASGGSSFAWSNSLGSNAAVTVSPTTATTYTVTVTQNNCSATASQAVTVNQLPVAAILPASSTICAGASATLTASGGTSYLWNTNSTTAAITVSPGATIAYTVTVTDANGCSATAQRTVTVNPLPVAAISPSSVAICLGSSQVLTASGGASYVWSGNLTANAIQNLSPSTTTTYTTTVTDANNCSATASATITVNSTTAAINGPTTICSGLSATLTASGGGTYSWSNSETTAAITVTPANATTYTVTVTANNCTATASQTVSVQNTPTASITGSTSVCAGGSVSLTANGGNTYTWGNGLGTNSTITVSPATTTTYTVTASLGANCSASATHTISILQPSASSFSETICAGNSYSFNGESLTQSGAYNDTLVNAAGCDSVITLNLTVSPALTGDFSETICNGNSYTFFAQTLTQSGNYTETVQTQDGCDSIITLHLTVLAPITTTLSESICQGGSYDFNGDILTIAGVYADTLASTQNCDSIVTLTLSIAGATAITTQPVTTLTVCAGDTIDLNALATGGNLAYQWWKNDTLISGAEAATFNIASSTVSDAGTYKVEVTGTCGADTSDAAVVVVNSTPAPVVQQNNAVLTSSVTGSSYQWYLGGGPVALATAQTYTATQTGNYKVDVTSADGCTGTSAEVNVIISGITNIASASIAVYPNPATSLLIIKSDVAIQTVEVHNVLGAKVLTETGNITRLDINMLAQGSYVVTIQTTSGVVKKSFIKE